MVKTHKFNGVKFNINLDEIYGLCDEPITQKTLKETPVIRITRGLPYSNKRGAKTGLITLIHECLHAERWLTTENKIEQISNDIGSLLWRLGYRRIK